ncbi:hypothetical protein H5410_051080, partial [Solanum commersonii]
MLNDKAKIRWNRSKGNSLSDSSSLTYFPKEAFLQIQFYFCVLGLLEKNVLELRLLLIGLLLERVNGLRCGLFFIVMLVDVRKKSLDA